MNRFLLFFLVLVTNLSFGQEMPLPDGEYVFSHRFAEHPNMSGGEFNVTIDKGTITVINSGETSVFPRGLIDEGQIYWHSLTSQWIIVSSQTDKQAKRVGGCSDGPTVIDLENKVYWTC